MFKQLLLQQQHLLRLRLAAGCETIEVNSAGRNPAGFVAALPRNGVMPGRFAALDQCFHATAEKVVGSRRVADERAVIMDRQEVVTGQCYR